MLPSASVLAYRREERVQKAFSGDHHGHGDAGLRARATPSQRPKMRLCARLSPSSRPTAANNMNVSILIDLDGFSIELCTSRIPPFPRSWLRF